MALFNYATKEITIKIVYYGPGLSGKTTNLQYLHSIFDPSKRGKLLSLATEADRTLFFDFLPVELGKISDFSIRFQLYTVPGQVRYNATRKLVLKGADAVVFVADSQREIREQNRESLKNMKENLIANNINPDEIPIVFQYNKRDLANILSVDELNKDLNENRRYDFREATAIDGTGVEDTFQHITRLVLKGISERHKIKVQPSSEFVEAVFEEEPEKEVVAVKPSSEKVPAFEASMSQSSETDVERPTRELSGTGRESVQTLVGEEPALPKEGVTREIREVPVIPKEKMDSIVNGINEISQTLKDLRDVVSGVHAEIKDMKKDQKEISARLRDVTNTVENIKTKRKWFSLS
jgi:signal recognition particle receptor subunit beta